MRLNRKVAWVTGGGSGIGAAICQRFAEEGARVVVTDIDSDAAAKVAAGIEKEGGQALAISQDVTSEERWHEVVMQIIEKYGCLDILVNNAGIALMGSVEEASLEDWRTTQQVNMEAVFLGTREAVKTMKETGGSIINISSIEGIIGEPLLAAYNASKGGVRIFTKSAALHCANSGYDIRVNSIHPGYIDTAMVSGAFDSMSDAEATEFQNRVLLNIPLGEMGVPLDIANGALFLASDESRYMTGAELIIDGGYTAK